MNYLMIGAMSGCLVVIMGAFGAHALNEILDDYGKSIYNKAVLYHMFHSIAILILGLINKIQPEIQLSMSGWPSGVFMDPGSNDWACAPGVMPAASINAVSVCL